MTITDDQTAMLDLLFRRQFIHPVELRITRDGYGVQMLQSGSL